MKGSGACRWGCAAAGAAWLLLAPGLARASDQTIGLFLNDSAACTGYTLFAPMSYTDTYLINNDGKLVHSWKGSYLPGYSVYLLPTGDLLRTTEDARVEKYDWNGTVTWNYRYADATHRRHHDVEPLPNGNVLMIAWEFKNRVQAIAAGRNPDLLREGELWPEEIIEVKPTGDTTGAVVWEWHVWDHLVQDYDSTARNYGTVANHPELIDINYVSTVMSRPGAADWNHVNSVDYNAALDQVLLSVHAFSEVWVIDHSTTTGQAAGHAGGRYGKGGDLLYRWGNPAAYRAGNEGNEVFFRQHDAQWVEPGFPGGGHIMVFNNGLGRGFSSADEFVPPVDGNGHYPLVPGFAWAPESLLWTYQADPVTDLYSEVFSGVQRLANGNTMICSGVDGTFTEVTAAGRLVWKYVNPVGPNGPMDQGELPPGGGTGGQAVNGVFRATRYPLDYPGLAGRDLTPGGPIEHYPSSIGETPVPVPSPRLVLDVQPNPARLRATIVYQLPAIPDATVAIYDASGRLVRTLARGAQRAGEHRLTWDATDAAGVPVLPGVYFCRLAANGQVATGKLVLLR